MPALKEEIRQRLANLNLHATREPEIIEELAQHLEDRYRESLAAGVSREQARLHTLRELSDGGFLETELRHLERTATAEPQIPGGRRKNMIGDIWQDLRYCSRTLLNNRGFTAVAVLTLLLGMGFNTSLFSLFNAMLLRPLPPSKTLIGSRCSGEANRKREMIRSPFSMPDFNDVRDQGASRVDPVIALRCE